MSNSLVAAVADRTLGQVLADRARLTPDAPFIHFGPETVTYADMQNRASRLSAGLSAAGIGRGDRVAIAASNSPEWLVAYFGAARIGAVLVTLNVVYREHEFTYMLGQSGARLLICDEESGGFQFRPFLTDLAPRLPSVERVVFLGASGADSWDALIDGAAPDSDAGDPAVTPTDPAVVLYTSGTTGDPKGATLTHASLLASAAMQAERFHQTSDDVLLGALPFNHVGGLTCAAGSSLVAGGAVALLPRFHPDLVVDAVRRTRLSIFCGVPTMYRMLLAADAFARCDLSATRLCVIGGSNLEPALAEQVVTRFGGPRLANLYGLSETSGACVISPDGDTLEIVTTTIGTPLDGVRARIVDDDRIELSRGTAGELEIRGACVAAGYWDKPAETAATFAGDGWLATGDIATMTDDGHISIVARKKEMYVRGGYNVYPAEVENVLAADPAVAMSAVIGVADPTYGETGYAFVVAAAGVEVDVRALIERCRRELAEYKVPDAVEVVDALPMTPAGKIRKVLLRPSRD
ncbi:class I adenylate-forming enzyme family protein [Gordonia neofelifaecis]|uniref:AMP-dependent synthetase and ligase n=1 Tax=Gordonia neofelifaecis NRRL B-59395 TaxID=644548 RepID=F1YE43_9ACTN|nr:AMP-binding protein [Gordonia neofelifaecis]EGD57133.1 AMP-dependent synthetase and ligase [Gordonia neofelifaecis NRRL B-59395]